MNKIEIDGPPKSHFHIGDQRFTYKTFAASSDTEGILVAGLVYHVQEMHRKGVVVWRQKPELWSDASGWHIYYRVCVVPFDALSALPLVEIPEKPEGALAQRI